MRLSEITKDNVNWAILSDLSLDLVDDAQDTLDALHVLIQSQSPSRNRAMLPILNYVKSKYGLNFINLYNH